MQYRCNLLRDAHTTPAGSDMGIRLASNSFLVNCQERYERGHGPDRPGLTSLGAGLMAP